MNRISPSNSAFALRMLFSSLFFLPGTMVGDVRAESGIVDTLPPISPLTGAKTVSAQSKLIVTVDTNWTESYGYRPIKFKFESPKPGVNDRSITVRFYAHDWRRQRVLIGAEENFNLPAGVPQETFTLAVPQHSPWSHISWDIWVDGRLDSTLSRPRGKILQHPVHEGVSISVLSPSNHSFAEPWARWGNRWQRQSNLLGRFPLEAISDEFPDDWLLYSGLDIVRVPLDDLQALASDKPQTFAALRKWVLTGGTLWVEKSGPRFERLGELDDLLAMDALPHFLPDSQDEELASEPNSDSANGGETANKSSPKTQEQQEQSEPDKPARPPPFPETPLWYWAELPWRNGQQGYDFGFQRNGSARIRQRQSNAPTSKDWFIQTNLGFGVVAAYRTGWDDRLSRVNPASAQAFANHWAASIWSQRHGMAPNAASNDFSNLLIPDVGLAPVTLFRVLITLFVLVAGPLNFWVLNRRQRSQLMVLTVPLTALLLTAGLFAYALLADGFGVQVRARSLTLLDQPSQTQTVWSRNTYYAGMAPSGGLSFPVDTAVYPILPGWNDTSAVGAHERERSIQWRDDLQHLPRGWITSRETAQLLTVRSGQSEARVDFNLLDERLRATNRLGADLTLLIAIDQEQSYWLVEPLADQAASVMRPSTRRKANIALRTLVTDNAPMLPAALDASENNPLVEGQRRQLQQRMRRELGVDYAPISMRENRMNALLDRLVGADGSDPLNLPARSFVAVSETTIAAPLGIDTADESGSFHVTVGRW